MMLLTRPDHIELAIPEEEDFDASRGILIFNNGQPLLLVDFPSLSALLSAFFSSLHSPTWR